MGYAHQVEVFSIKPLLVQTDGIEASTCYLDELGQFEEKLSRLSKNTIKDKVKDKENELLKLMQCQYKASLYQLNKLPAIVIDGEYVAYGIDSVSKALSLIKDKGEAYA